MQAEIKETIVFTDYINAKNNYTVLIVHLGDSGSFTKKKIATVSLLRKHRIEKDANLTLKVQTSIDAAHSRGTFFYVTSVHALSEVLEINDEKPEKVLKLTNEEYEQLLVTLKACNI